MKKSRLFLALMTLILCSGMTSFAQTHFGLRLGGALPMGDFAEAKVTKSGDVKSWALIQKDGKYGGAAFGFNVGAIVKFDISSVSGLGIVASLDFIYNDLNSDIKDAAEVDDNDYVEIEYTLPKYFNIPIMVGVNYTLPLSDAIGVYGEAALGLNLRKITKCYIHREEDNAGNGNIDYESEIELTYDMAKTFGFRLGGGIIFNERFSIGIDYYALGSEKVKGEVGGSYSESGGSPHNLDAKYSGQKALSTNILMIRCGIMF